MRVVDILEERRYIDQFEEVREGILKSSDRNAQNYGRFFDGPNLYENISVDVVLDDHDEIVAFAAMHGDGRRYPLGFARAVARYWIRPDHRRNGLSRIAPMDYGSGLIMPKQIEDARRRGLEAVFVTMEFPRRRAALQRIANLNPHVELKVLEHMYFTCDQFEINQNSPTCWQNVGITWLGHARRLPLPRMEITEWNARFGNINHER